MGRLEPVACSGAADETRSLVAPGFERPLARVKRSKMVAGHQRPVFAAAAIWTIGGERLTSV